MSEYSATAGVDPAAPDTARDAERWRAQDVRLLAAATMLSERTVYRWLEAPERTTSANRRRLEAARAQHKIKTGPSA